MGPKCFFQNPELWKAIFYKIMKEKSTDKTNVKAGIKLSETRQLIGMFIVFIIC